MLLGSYRSGEANDPEVYISSIVRVISAYPLEIVQRVIDPLTGIPSKIEWLPKPFEVKRELEELYGPIRRTNEWDERSKKQLEERAQREAEASQPRADLKAKYGENYGLTVTKLPDTDEDRTKHLNRMAAFSDSVIARDYAARGEEPKLYSRALADNVRAKNGRDFVGEPMEPL